VEIKPSEFLFTYLFFINMLSDFFRVLTKVFQKSLAKKKKRELLWNFDDNLLAQPEEQTELNSI